MLVLLGLATGTAAQARTNAENQALRALCPIGLKAKGVSGRWGNERINAAIATIGFGNKWPDGAQATAYKLCNYGGYLK
ncbi:hypothetical protein SynPROS71_01270 [Synechococcus sp. PROS-7-1]|nr:hypothetical protein SynPROS71_01270 [Synechococcus sp. PROS-7-1]